jgi:hypothetical protein
MPEEKNLQLHTAKARRREGVGSGDQPPATAHRQSSSRLRAFAVGFGFLDDA